MSVEVKNLDFAYDPARPVLRDVSFTAKSGEFLSILGPNGVGKSTLFRCVLGLLRGWSGEIRIDGEDASALSVSQMAKHVAYIPQSSGTAFNYSVMDIVLMGTTSRVGALSTPKKAELEAARLALEKAGIAPLAERCYHHLSGGERQLVMIARALAQKAPVLMLDEPTASLDFGNQVMVLQTARSLAAEGYTVIQTTHNPEQTYMYSDRILTLKGGRVLVEGSPKEVLTGELMEALYGVETEVSSLHGDRVRVCTPKALIG